MDIKESDPLRALLDSPREIADEILDLTTLLGVLLAGDDAETCLPGIYLPAQWHHIRARYGPEGAPSMQPIAIYVAIWRLPADALVDVREHQVRAARQVALRHLTIKARRFTLAGFVGAGYGWLAMSCGRVCASP